MFHTLRSARLLAKLALILSWSRGMEKKVGESGTKFTW